MPIVDYYTIYVLRETQRTMDLNLWGGGGGGCGKGGGKIIDIPLCIE